MSGHSKWANIKHRKASADAKKGKLFSNLSKEIIIAAKHGGGNPETNPNLKAAIERAKEANMPKENIERAIKRGTGEIQGITYEEITYEGYGPGGVAILIEVVTDNKNRTASEIRRIFTRYGGNLGEAGCVAWIFEDKGSILIDRESIKDEEQLITDALEVGAEDVEVDSEDVAVITDPQAFSDVRAKLQEKGYKIIQAEVTKVPKNLVPVDGPEAEKLLKLMEELEDLDDVQKTYANFDIPDEILQTLS
ncbi:MAG TPA: YebC/PmpR family DNA-binding transcriptional regulator [Dictyoglomaceae bacterium]|nr:YebC/PmpR family DNA-binding transcriptional regulator [Dictyoglomaceae bacterium]HOL39686.1 YebC/PmpR family DNA-binding transcriptional regulator [Dictyoglomaceae bacterium]HPP16045.1 YebC/PmpR family DNA-binding transcriptional regulator [Dictyoglomaceae bacterium]